MLSLRSVYDSLSNACLKPTFLLLSKKKIWMFPTQIMRYLENQWDLLLQCPLNSLPKRVEFGKKKVDVQWKALGGKWG